MNPTSNIMKSSKDRRISDEIEITTPTTETGFSRKRHLRNSSKNLPDAKNAEQTSTRARGKRNDSGYVQENKKFPLNSITKSKNVLIPKNKPTITPDAVLKDPKKSIPENKQTNMTLLKVGRKCSSQKVSRNEEQSSKSSNAIENSESMTIESEAQNTDVFLQCKENKLSGRIVPINNDRFQSLALSPSIAANSRKCTEQKKPNKERFEVNNENINSFKNLFIPVIDENSFTIGFKRNPKYENVQYKRKSPCKTLSNENSVRIDSDNEDKSTLIFEYTHDRCKTQRKEVQSKPDFENPVKNTTNKEHNMLGSTCKSISDENPFTIRSSRDPERENVQHNWKNSFLLVPDANPFKIESDEEGKRNQGEHMQRKWRKNSTTPGPSKNPISVAPTEEKIHNSGSKFEPHEKQSRDRIQGNKDENKRKSLLPVLQNDRKWNKALQSILLQDKEPRRGQVLENENSSQKFKKNERVKICNSSASNKHRKHNEEPIRKKYYLRNKQAKEETGKKKYYLRERMVKKEHTLSNKERGRKKHVLRGKKARKNEKKNDKNKTHKANRDKVLNRKKTIQVAVENTQKKPILEKIEMNTKICKDIIYKKLVQRKKDQVFQDDNNTLGQMFKGLDTLDHFIFEDMNGDPKKSLEENSSSLTSISDSTSVSSFELKNQKSTKLMNCREAENVPYEDRPVKKTRIEGKIKEFGDNERSSTEENMQDINCDTSVFPITDLKLYESDLRSDDVLGDILSWDPVEFMAVSYSNCKACLENYKKLLNLSSKTYKDHESYCRTLVSFLLFDIACEIRSKFSVIEENPFLTKSIVLENSATKVLLIKRNSYLLSFKIKFACSESNISQVPLVGDLLSIELMDGTDRPFKIIFAYLREVSIDKEIDPIFLMGNENFQLSVTCIIVTKLLDFNIYESQIKSLRVIVRALAVLNLAEALENLKKSALLPMILHPEPETFRLSHQSSNLKHQELQENLDHDQLNAVKNITNVIQDEEPKICLIEGPPGTGKTNVATNIILQILSMQEDVNKQNQPMKILVCAKSKSAIDEILIRLSTEVKRLGVNRNLVRVGNPNNVHEKVRSFTLRELAKKENAAEPYSNLVEEEILKKADVIFCTLSMCLSGRMSSIFGDDNPIRVCIVDEATEANEIEILKALSFEVRQLILLADRHTYSSRNIFLWTKFNKMSCLAENLKLNSSLFSRMLANFEGSKKSPVIKLEAQYRMNKVLVFLINQFLNNAILKYKHLIQKEFPLYSCSVFSLKTSNLLTFAENLIFCILNFTHKEDYEDFEKPISIGVIVAQSSLKTIVKAKIEQRISAISMEKREQFTIDVNTVGGFSNQERDILIIMCTNENSRLLQPSGEQWLYKAMTKVKYSLIIFGDKYTFEKTEKVCLWNSFIKYLKDNEHLMNINDPADPEELLAKLINSK